MLCELPNLIAITFLQNHFFIFQRTLTHKAEVKYRKIIAPILVSERLLGTDIQQVFHHQSLEWELNDEPQLVD